LSRKSTPFIIDEMSLNAVGSAHNKTLRKELLDCRVKRDKFLSKRIQLLKPFLPEKVYFHFNCTDRVYFLTIVLIELLYATRTRRK
jgi:hypothetical protein